MANMKEAAGERLDVLEAGIVQTQEADCSPSPEFHEGEAVAHLKLSHTNTHAKAHTAQLK